jgi:hypothetical protein
MEFNRQRKASKGQPTQTQQTQDIHTMDQTVFDKCMSVFMKKNNIEIASVNHLDFSIEDYIYNTVQLCPVGPHEAIGDNGATGVGVISANTFASNARRADRTHHLKGIGGTLTTDVIVDTPFEKLGGIPYHPDAPCNIFGWSMLLDAYPHKTRDLHHDALVFISITNIIVFKRKTNRLMVADMTKSYTFEQLGLKPVIPPQLTFAEYNNNGGRVPEHLIEASYSYDCPADLTLPSLSSQAISSLRPSGIKSLNAAEEFQSKTNHRHLAAATKAIRNNYFTNLPARLTPDSLAIREQVLGPDVHHLKGRTKRKTARHLAIEAIPKLIAMFITLYCDLFFIDQMTYLISVAYPTKYIVATPIHSKNASDLGKGMDLVLSKYQKHACVVKHIVTDREGGLLANEVSLGKLGIILHPLDGASANPAEVAISHVRAHTRTTLSTIPCQRVPTKLKMGAVLASVSMCNVMSGAHLALTGQPVDYKRQMKGAFGDYCQGVPAGTTSNSVDIERTNGFIHCGYTFAAVGSIIGLNLKTYAIARYLPENTTVFPTWPDLVRQRVDEWAQRDGNISAPEKDIELTRYDTTTISELDHSVSDWYTTTDDDINIRQPMPETSVSINSPDDVDADGIDYDYNIRTSPRLTLGGDDGVEPPPKKQFVNLQSGKGNQFVKTKQAHNNQFIRRNTRVQHPTTMTLRPKTPKQWVHILHDANDYINESINIVKESIIDATEMCYYNSNECIDTTDNIEQYSSAFNHVWSDDPFFDYVLNISVKNAIQKFGKEIAFESITKELEQLHGSKSLRPTWQGVHYKNLSEKEKRSIIRSHMFLKEKYFQTGKFEKLKARLVGGGHMQDKSLYNEYETASPTVSTTSVFLLATIAATERRQVATIDIPGAYLHAQLDPQSPPIHMSLDKIMTEALCHIDPTFKQFVRHDKTSIVKLTRAIYGLLESAKLWNKDISSTLVNNGFQLNPHDDCVFNKMHNNNQISIAIHVDDLFITCKTVDGINYVRNILELKYGNIQFNHDPTSPISYLGMIFDFSTPGVVSISQPKFINDLLHSQSESRTASTPASSDLFHIDESTLLQPKQQDTYHSVSASLLYLAKRTRPDILLAVSYLSTRVGKANMSDYNKLNRVLRYLNST